MLPDFGSFWTQSIIGTMPFHLFTPGAKPIVMQTSKKLFAITFVVEHDGQRLMGTLETEGDWENALRTAEDLISSGVYCQARPDLAYVTTENSERVVPFRLYEKPEPLTQEAQNRIRAAEAKRARKARKVINPLCQEFQELSNRQSR